MKHLYFAFVMLVIFVATGGAESIGQTSPAYPATAIEVREGLKNAHIQFQQRKKATVAFIGGSITEMEGHRPLVCRRLKERFPETDFTFINAGLASTCSNTGAFRLERDVLSQAPGPVDLLFVEFAVNDDQDGRFTKAECIRGMEGIIRQAKIKNPSIDVVMTFFVNEGMIKTYQAGKVPLSIEAHSAVAEQYGVPTVNVAAALTAMIKEGKMTWQQYGGVHPTSPGHELCAAMMEELFRQSWGQPTTQSQDKPPQITASEPVAHKLPVPLDTLSYSGGGFISPGEAKIVGGWTLGVPDWNAQPKAGVRKQFKDVPMLCAVEPGAEATLEFEGTAVGAFVVSGPDSGIVEVVVDSGAPKQMNLAYGPCAALYYPWTVIFESGLKPGKHLLRLRMSDKTDKPGKTGHAMRIVQFVVNNASASAEAARK